MSRNSEQIIAVGRVITKLCEKSLPADWRLALTDFSNDPCNGSDEKWWGVVLLRPYPIFNGPSSPGYGRLASIGYGRDYHLELYDQLERITQVLETVLGDLPRRFFVDKDGGDDRLIAYHAGLGFYGKHNLLIHPDLGSGFNIGYAMYPMAPGLEMVKSAGILAHGCGACQRCIEGCPTQALSEGRPLDRARCRSAINQKSGELDAREQEMIGEWLYGCDICQMACPYNQGALVEGETSLQLAPLIEMSQREIKVAYGDRAFGYLGGGRLKRNAKIILQYWESQSLPDENKK